jgi:Putative peptidoglycan binding domain
MPPHSRGDAEVLRPGPVAPFERSVGPVPRFAPEGLSRGLTPRIVIGLQRAAGNARVTGWLQRSAGRGPLTPDQIDAAIDAHQHGPATFDALADRTIQSLAGAPVTGRFDRRTAVELAIFQRRVGLPANGIVDEPTTNVLLTDCVRAGRYDEGMHLVMIVFAVDPGSLALSVRYNAALPTAAGARTEIGGLQVIEVGPSAFADAATLSHAVAQVQSGRILTVPLASRTPAVLTPAEAMLASLFNRPRFDTLSCTAIANLIGSPSFDLTPDASQFIAEFQGRAGLPVNGKIDDPTLREFVARLIAGGSHNAAVHLLIEAHEFGRQGLLVGVLDVAADLSLADEYAIESPQILGPSTVRLGPDAFAQGLAGLTHTIAHALVEAREIMRGRSQEVRDFLAARTEILSVGMDEESFGVTRSATSAGGGFIRDADDALRAYRNMTLRERRRMWPDFEEVRDKVRTRFKSATPADRNANAAIIDRYDAQTRPR